MSKPMRDQFPDIARCVDDLRAMGFTITAAAVYDADGTLLAGRLPMDDPADVALPAERVIAMQVWARSPESVIAKVEPKVKRKGRKA